MNASLTTLESHPSHGRQFIVACDDKHCNEKFKYTDWVVHSKVDGPDPRDHFANERNFLSWLRTGMTLALIGFMTLIDLRSKNFAPSHSLPWSTEEPTPYKTRVVAFIMVGLGVSSLCVSVVIYFKNQYRILHRLLDVGHGWPGYSMALLIMMFICFIMIVALTEVR